MRIVLIAAFAVAVSIAGGTPALAQSKEQIKQQCQAMYGGVNGVRNAERTGVTDVSLNLLAGLPRVGAALDAGSDRHAVAVTQAVLLHDHDVGARRQRRAGEDAGSKAARQRYRV